MQNQALVQRMKAFFLGRLYIREKQLGVVYGSNGLFSRFLFPGENRRVSRLFESRQGHISTAPFAVIKEYEGLSDDGFRFKVKLKVIGQFDPSTVPNRVSMGFAVQKCLEDGNWPKMILDTAVNDAIKQALGNYKAWDIHSGRMFRVLVRELKPLIKTGLVIPGFDVLKVVVESITPPRELVEAKEQARTLLIHMQEALATMPRDKMADLQLWTQMHSVIQGLGNVHFQHTSINNDNPDTNIQPTLFVNGQAPYPKAHRSNRRPPTDPLPIVQ